MLVHVIVHAEILRLDARTVDSDLHVALPWSAHTRSVSALLRSVRFALLLPSHTSIYRIKILLWVRTCVDCVNLLPM
jgi:hypothetical protein